MRSRLQLEPDVPGLPLAGAYVDVFARFNTRLNAGVLAELSASCSHAIDGSEFLLFDTRFVPGFGLQVNEGLTVWTKAKNYIWMNAMLLRFVELATESKLASSVIIHLECTELCESAQSQSQSRASSADDRR